MSPLVIASVFLPESYVSFEAGLNFYQLFDQMVKTVTSVCRLKSKKYYFQDLEYRFVKIREDLYFDFNKMVDYVERYPVGVKRRLGFLLDLLEIDTEKLRKQLAGNTGYSKLPRKSKIFNSKWRIYYGDRFIEEKGNVSAINKGKNL